jgi:predicted RNase H-like nuclease (RuvC/YqgF family)
VDRRLEGSFVKVDIAALIVALTTFLGWAYTAWRNRKVDRAAEHSSVAEEWRRYAKNQERKNRELEGRIKDLETELRYLREERERLGHLATTNAELSTALANEKERVLELTSELASAKAALVRLMQEKGTTEEEEAS